MGFLSGLKKLGKKVCGAVKKVAKKVAECAKKVVETVAKPIVKKVVKPIIEKVVKPIAQKCAKVCSSFTGKKKFDEAKELYQKLQNRMDKEKLDYESFVEKKTNEISREITKINQLKMSLNEEHFQRFLRVSSRIASWDIVLKELPDRFHYSQIKIEEIKKRDELFLIDFDKNPIKSNLMALVSLGFWSRKKATETLHKVQEQEKVLEHELAKLETEKVRLKAILESLRNVALYFEELTKIYDGILDELEYTVNLVVNSGYVLNPAYQENKVDCYMFPEKHLLCLMAADKMTRILFEMTTLRYLSHQGELIESDQATFKEKRQVVRLITEKLAA